MEMNLTEVWPWLHTMHCGAPKVALSSDTPPETLDLVALLPQRWAAFLRNSQSA